MNYAYLSFNGGEISPYGHHRTDLDKHASGLALAENFLPMPFGGMRKRPGSLYLAALPANAALHAFDLTSGSSYILALSTTEIRIYRPDGSLADTVSLTIPNPFAVQLLQINDVIFITSNTLEPQRLSRLSDTDWAIEPIPFTNPPFLQENLLDSHTLATTLDPSDQNPVESSLSLTAVSVPITSSVDFFDAGHIGAQFEISHERDIDDFKVIHTLTSTHTSSHLVIEGAWRIVTFGSWNGTLTIQRYNTDTSSWDDYKSYESNLNANYDDEFSEDSAVLLRLHFAANAGGANWPRASLEALKPTISGTVEITAVTDAQNATATTIRPVKQTTTEFWREGAFSDFQGYPATLCLHENRLVFAGTTLAPNTVWMSKTDDLINFKEGDLDDDAVNTTLAASRQDRIRWVFSEKNLIIGTESSEWVAGPLDGESFLTPTSTKIRKASSNGSEPIPALQAKASTLFVQRHGRRLLEFTYSYEDEKYRGIDLSRLAEHITESGIIQIAYQPNRESILWATLANGTLLSFHYAREEKIAAWTRHTIGGGVSSITTLRNNTDDDDLYLVTSRNGSYHLEKFAPGQQAVQEQGLFAQSIHLDAATSVTHDPPSNTLSGIASIHNNTTITVIADGFITTALVTDNSLTLDEEYTTITAGLPFTATLTSLPVDLHTQQGPTHSLIKTPYEITLDLFQSLGGNYLYSGNQNTIRYDNAESLGQTPSLFTGWSKNTFLPNHRDNLVFSISHPDPTPFTLRSAVIKFKITEQD